MTQFTPQLTAFVQRVGISLQAYIPRAAAEIFGLLVIADEPLSVDEIASSLRISRASVTANIRILESHGVIQKISQPGVRHARFGLCDDPFARILERISDRFRDLADAAKETGATTPRLSEMCRTFESASSLLAQWRHS